MDQPFGAGRKIAVPVDANHFSPPHTYYLGTVNIPRRWLRPQTAWDEDSTIWQNGHIRQKFSWIKEKKNALHIRFADRFQPIQIFKKGLWHHFINLLINLLGKVKGSFFLKKKKKFLLHKFLVRINDSLFVKDTTQHLTCWQPSITTGLYLLGLAHLCWHGAWQNGDIYICSLNWTMFYDVINRKPLVHTQYTYLWLCTSPYICRVACNL